MSGSICNFTVRSIAEMQTKFENSELAKSLSRIEKLQRKLEDPELQRILQALQSGMASLPKPGASEDEQ